MANQKMAGISQKVMELVSGIMLPTMGALVGCGLVSALCTILTMTGLVAQDSGTYLLLHGMGQTCLYFFPILVGGSAAKYFGIDGFVGNVIGAALIYPDFVAAAQAGETTTLFGLVPLTWTNYSSTVLPAIVAVWFASVVYKALEKVVPEVARLAVVSFVTVLVTVPVSLLVIGPVMNAIGLGLSQLTLAVYNLSPLVCSVALCSVWQMFIIPLGLHWGFVAVVMNNLVTLGSDPIMGMVAAGLTLCGTLLAVGVKAKRPQTRSLAFSTALTNFFGISEPGLFGIALIHKQTIIATCVGYAASGVVTGLFGTRIYLMAGSGIFALPGYLNPSGDLSSFIGAVLANVVGLVVSFLLTMALSFDPDEGVEEKGQADEA